ncbi:hypothetical protein CEUSTIGMA_g12567.t1 [Chlamydomonas eustigma]|uniref:SF3 helicase domain-containing protein n=1 Tax=Chlamydomonas eustigma TaxID=1157962 RepID=A0A250XQ11_9CHLO|nr:hypothetical protein CEUSTIGMA_g12567.t1 [Chlamydomonas eustigma]|eukprot:GAX85148.1 hypothetical protein CEUSTIGMA_g12567.t1 [Chlamydomonas eustigma]
MANNIEKHILSFGQGRIILRGAPGCGKTTATRILTYLVGGVLVPVFDPTRKCGSLWDISYYVRTMRGSNNWIIVVMEEFDGVLQKLDCTHNKCSKEKDVEVVDKASWNCMMDQLSYLPKVVLIMTTNETFENLNTLEKAAGPRNFPFDLRMETEKLQAFIERHRVSRGAEFTHTQLGAHACSFYVPYAELETFFDLYCACPPPLHITERHRTFSPLCIDIDLRHARLQRMYTMEHLSQVVRAYSEALVKYVGPIVLNSSFYILEKAAPRADPKKLNVYKDGVHIIAPGIVTRPAVLHLVRLDAINSLRTMYAELDSLNMIEDAFDEAVVSRNNWFLHGSRKPGEGETSYSLSMVLDGLGNQVETQVLTHAQEVRLLSVRNKHEQLSVLPEQLERVIEHEQMSIRPDPGSMIAREGEIAPEFRVTYTGEDDLEHVCDVARLLSPQRFLQYDSWIRVGWCLRNIDDTLLPLWDELSKQASNYAPGVCANTWARMRQGSLGVGTLHMWARTDDPVGYTALRSKTLHGIITNGLSGTHNDIARVVHAMFKHRFVCASVRSKTWYEFVGHRWKLSDTGCSLRRRFSSEVWQEFIATSIRYQQRSLSSPSGHADQQDLLEKSKKLTALALQLKNTDFKDKIMKECMELFYEEKFEERLDSNLNLIGFENGVYDLDAEEFRDGRPDDMITFSTGNDFAPYDAHSPAADELQEYLAQVLTKPDMREYVLKLFASFLHGATKEQKFYIWTGSGSNSKSKLVELFELAFGDYCCKLPVTLLTQKRAASNAATSEVANAKGKRFASLQEPSEADGQINVGLMKELSGGDRIMARCIYKEPIEFKPQFKMILLCNYLPDVPSDDGGTWRRIRVVEFTSKFVDKPNPDVNDNEFPIDIDLLVKLQRWKEAFMALLLLYYKRYIVEGIEEPAEVLRCTSEYKQQNDHLADFVQAFVQKDEHGFLSCNEAYVEAKGFARENSITKPIGKKNFDEYLKRALNSKIVLQGGVRGIKGFRMRVPINDDSE